MVVQGTKPTTYTSLTWERSFLNILAMEISIEPQLLNLVVKGCQASQWPIKARFRGEPLAVLISVGNVSKHSGQLTSDMLLSSLGQPNKISAEMIALQFTHLVGRIHVWFGSQNHWRSTHLCPSQISFFTGQLEVLPSQCSLSSQCDSICLHMASFRNQFLTLLCKPR